MSIKNTDKLSTEAKILAAAEQVFLRSGYDGSRMQEIADLAGINKAMLHYYFRSKDLLFERIFEQKFISFFPQIQELSSSPLSFTDKICQYSTMHINLLRQNPYLPLFIINTVHKNRDFAQRLPITIATEFVQSYYDDLAADKVRSLNPIQFLVSVMSMCIFPFLSKPILQHMAALSDLDFDAFMEQRSQEIQTYIRSILQATPPAGA